MLASHARVTSLPSFVGQSSESDATSFDILRSQLPWEGGGGGKGRGASTSVIVAAVHAPSFLVGDAVDVVAVTVLLVSASRFQIGSAAAELQESLRRQLTDLVPSGDGGTADVAVSSRGARADHDTLGPSLLHPPRSSTVPLAPPRAETDLTIAVYEAANAATASLSKHDDNQDLHFLTSGTNVWTASLPVTNPSAANPSGGYESSKPSISPNTILLDILDVHTE